LPAGRLRNFSRAGIVAIAASESRLPSMSTDLAQLAADRYEIADALHRFAFGLDHGDADSLASTLIEDCVLDFRPAGRKLGLDFPKLTGRQAIVDALIPLLGPLDTSHTISNLQIEISDDSATLYGYVLAQHFMPRQGPKPDGCSARNRNRRNSPVSSHHARYLQFA